MKVWILCFVTLMVWGCTSQQVEQGVDILMNETMGGGSLSSEQAAQGLKAALNQGAKFSGGELSRVDGFLKNQAIQILFPPEFQRAEKTLRDLGLGSLADQAVVSFNRAAEKASAKAFPILSAAVQKMTFADAMNILLGPKNAATSYLKKTTSSALQKAFLPVVKKSADDVYATKYWDQVASTYNKVPFVKKVPSDISGYITEKTLAGLFHRMAIEEKHIRDNPGARASQILKSVFGYADKQKQ